MDGSFTRSARVAWMARWQEIAPRLAFWLLLVGYDVRDRSRTDLLYVPYLVAFWLAWAFAMFTAISGALATLLELVNPTAPASAAASVTIWALLAWVLVSLYQAARRSPLIFSPSDAALLCQAPVDRRALVLVWILTEWPLRALPFAVWALAAGFALFEVRHVVEGVDLPTVVGYWADGLRALVIVLPLHFTLLALVWTAGAWRLQGRRKQPLLRCLPVVVTLVFVMILMFAWGQGPFELPDSTWWRAVAWPLLAAFGQRPWLPALLVATAGGVAALGVLLTAGRNLNLSRAAQETSHIHSERFLTQVGARQAARHLKRERLLGAGRPETAIPAAAGWWSTIWKDVTRTTRTWREELWPWFRFFVVTVGVVAAPDWGSRLVAVAIWVYVTTNRSTSYLGDNLAHWWLWRQQPFAAWQLVGASLVPPGALLVLLSLAAAVIGRQLPLSTDFPIAPLLPFLSIEVALAATWSLLRDVRPDRLLDGDVPGVTVLGAFLSLLLVCASLGIAVLVARATGLLSLAIATGALVSVLFIGAQSYLVANRAGQFA